MIRLSGDDPTRYLGLIEDVVPALHGGPPLHEHACFDEGFYLREGELEFRVGDVTRTIRAGEIALARRGVLHSVANRTDRDVRVLTFVTPPSRVEPGDAGPGRGLDGLG